MDIQVACCFHPTLVVSVDDNQKYHNIIKLSLDSNTSSCKFFVDPGEALEYLKRYTPTSFADYCLTELEEQHIDKRSIEVNIRRIINEINNPNRFNQIVVVILDYAMQGMNGGELAKKIVGMPFKIILLTGEADANIAVQLFNEKLIHAFIRKDDPDFNKKLKSKVNELENEYFQEQSTIIENSLRRSPDVSHSWITDPAFKDLVLKITAENELIERCLVDEFGSFIFLDADARPSILAVTNEEMLKTYGILADDDHAPSSIVEGIKNKALMPFFFSELDFKKSPREWGSLMHPAKKLTGKETYYYSFIKNPAINIDKSKILSYDQYLESK